MDWAGVLAPAFRPIFPICSTISRRISAGVPFMQLSYAQRLEDYHLACAFADQETGFYIDIGGGHPVADNVSYWFYLKGWNGLVVEPQTNLLDLYAYLRPRDIALGNLVGRQDGEADFHVVERLHGLSTTLADNARTAIQLGGKVTTERRPMRSLASLVAEHGIQKVDFLKIDVEGAEADVLAGADWTTCRPSVVLVETTPPGRMAASWAEWEPALLANGYEFILDDELNRFYVAQEVPDIAARLPRAPVAWHSAAHLYDFGRAHEREDHPDHVLAQTLVQGFLGALPRLDPALLADLLHRAATSSNANTGDAVDHLQRVMFGSAEYPCATTQTTDQVDHAATLRDLMASERFRAALGRIATAYDGGHIMD